jgi:hypothetical protein
LFRHARKLNMCHLLRNGKRSAENLLKLWRSQRVSRVIRTHHEICRTNNLQGIAYLPELKMKRDKYSFHWSKVGGIKSDGKIVNELKVFIRRLTLESDIPLNLKVKFRFKFES